VLRALPQPTDDTPWEAILDFRADPASKEVAESLAKLQWSKAAKALFRLSKDQIALLAGAGAPRDGVLADHRA
jgi:hypothetical protein